jgi:hypothetical protein
MTTSTINRRSKVMNPFKTLFSPIKDGDDVTTQFICVVAAVALIGGAILILAMLINIWFPARAERVKIAMHDEQTFQQLRQKHGQKATGIVVYEADGKAYYFLKGKKIELK